MKFFLLICCTLLGLSFAITTDGEKKDTGIESNIQDFDISTIDSDSKLTDIQKKRESGYFYSSPPRSSLNYHYYDASRPGYRERSASKRPSQFSRPFSRYGPPNYHSPSTKPSNPFSRPTHTYKPPQQSLHNQFSSSDISNQGIPSPVRNVDFVEHSPIASQNDQPFGSNTAIYLPPKNQKLPAYQPPDTFSQRQVNALYQNKDQFNSQPTQNLIQGDTNLHQISDAALFLTQNAEAISQLYGAPATNQNYAPNNEEFFNQNNQVQQQNNVLTTNEHSNDVQASSPVQTSQGFSGSLPVYASGILNNQETLQRIQSLEKDRLISQLQQALLQSQNSDLPGRYAQSHNNYVQNQNFLSNIASQFPSRNEQLKNIQNPFKDTQVLDSPSYHHSTVNPQTYTVGYDLPTTPQPTLSVATSTHKPSPTLSTNVGTSIGSSVPASGSHRPSVSQNFPQYGSFVPNIVSGTSFFGNVPSFNPTFVSSGSHGVSVKPIETTPTHFVIPIPGIQSQKPASTSTTVNIPATSPTSATRPTVSVPVSPGHPVSLPLNPVHSVIGTVRPITTQLRPIVPVNTITSVHPVVTPVVASPGQTAFGIQPAITNPVIYKPIKAVYPFYYQANVPLQGQKYVTPSNPWNYANAYPTANTTWK